MDKGLVKILSVLPYTPAMKAGLQAGDYITKIEGEAISIGITRKESQKVESENLGRKNASSAKKPIKQLGKRSSVSGDAAVPGGSPRNVRGTSGRQL